MSGMKISVFSNNDDRNNEAKVALVENGTTATIQPRSDAPVKVHRGSALRQVLAAFVANIGTVNTGLVFGFSAVVLPQLQSPNSTIPIDEEQASWIGK